MPAYSLCNIINYNIRVLTKLILRLFSCIKVCGLTLLIPNIVPACPPTTPPPPRDLNLRALYTYTECINFSFGGELLEDFFLIYFYIKIQHPLPYPGLHDLNKLQVTWRYSTQVCRRMNRSNARLKVIRKPNELWAQMS